MNPSEFQNWCQNLQFTAATREIINTIRSTPPARRVQGRALNVSGFYPSQKMGLTIQFESHTVELWAIYEMEHDSQVLEFYDQPSSFKIQYQAKNGRKIGHYHTPDFFVLRTDNAGWEEWKPEEKLQELALKYPSRYQKTQTGEWRCPPGVAYAEPLGLFYRVRSTEELHPIKIQNLMFLSDYFRLTKSKRGNRTPRAPSATRDLLDHFITEYFETPRQATAASVYRAYQRECEQRHLQALSSYTFYTRLHSRRSPEQTEKRLGAKAAYAEQPWLSTLAQSTPQHGDRPLAIVHIDHTQLDIELLCSTTHRNLGRPWLTMLIDAYSRRILAVYLTFDAPSYRSCMMGLRLIVQRCGRFPQAIVVDGGKEFHSIYFDTLLARYHCIKKTRPAAKPRFGSVIERLFGVTNTEFIFNLLGNTQASKQPRQLTKAIDPKRQAVWTLGELYSYLMEWAYSIYDQDEHPALGMTPRIAYMSGLGRAGEREHLYIPYSEEFLMATLPSTKKGFALVQPGKGIKINYLYYWSDAFRNPEVERTQVSIRYDPFNIGVAYAYLQGRWVRCISQYYSIFQGRSEKELSLASDEIRQRSKLTQTSTSVSAKRLADFLSNVQEHEALLLQRLRDLEALQVLETVAVKSEHKPVVEMVIPTLPEQRTSEDVAQQMPIVNTPVDLARLPIFEEYR